mmetsp:Transcript_103710/g.329771  ORF Transcript_103710/g.329771 Transcript_103710/m.329771 type:complete len:204 (-) Transcript_103710:206-817(-)
MPQPREEAARGLQTQAWHFQTDPPRPLALRGKWGVRVQQAVNELGLLALDNQAPLPQKGLQVVHPQPAKLLPAQRTCHCDPLSSAPSNLPRVSHSFISGWQGVFLRFLSLGLEGTGLRVQGGEEELRELGGGIQVHGGQVRGGSGLRAVLLRDAPQSPALEALRVLAHLLDGLNLQLSQAHSVHRHAVQLHLHEKLAQRLPIL